MTYEEEIGWPLGLGPHCVYGLFRPDGTPFYFGEGMPDRPFKHFDKARYNPEPLYCYMRELSARSEEIRLFILFEGLAKWRSCDLENALIAENLPLPVNKRLYRRKPEAIDYVRQHRKLWRLEPITGTTKTERR